MLSAIATSSGHTRRVPSGRRRGFGRFGWLARRVMAFARHDRAIAATEFALLLPVCILLYAAAGELSQATMTSRKVELLSRTIVDLTSQQGTSTQTSSYPAPGNAITQGTLQSIFNASSAVLAPGSTTSLKMTLTAVDIVNNGLGLCCQFKVRWSYTQSGTLRPCNTPLMPVSPSATPTPTTVSSALTPPIPSLPYPLALLIADVSYSYTAPFSSYWIAFPGAMTRTSYMYPRSPGQVLVAAPLATTGNQSGQICY